MSVLTFSTALGLPTLGPQSSEDKWDRLAQATGQEKSVLTAMQWPRAPTVSGIGQHSLMLGTRMATAFVNARAFRFCPACMRERRLGRQFWAIEYVVSCPLHSCLLRDACSRCGRKYVTAARPWGCYCGADFCDEPEEPAPVGAVRMAKNLAAIIGADLALGLERPGHGVDLPMPFDSLTAHDYIAYVHVVGKAATTSAADDTGAAETGSWYRTGMRDAALMIGTVISRITAAHEVFGDWPDAYRAILAEVEQRTPREPGKMQLEHAFASKIGQSLQAPLRDSKGLPLPLLVKAIDDFWRAKPDRVRRVRTLMTAHSVARRLGRKVTGTALVRELGIHIGQKVPRRVLQSVMDALDTEELALEDTDLAALVHRKSIEMAKLAKSSLSTSAAMLRLEGAEDASFKDWNHPELVLPATEMQGLRLAGKAMYLLSSVEGALDRLAGVAKWIKEPGSLVPLMAVTLRLGGIHARYKKTDLLLDLFRGKFRTYTMVERPRLCDIS